MSRYQSKYTGKQIDDALDSFKTVTQYTDKLTPSDFGYLEVRKSNSYQIFGKKEGNKFRCELFITWWNGFEDEQLVLPLDIVDPYDDHFTFRFLDIYHHSEYDDPREEDVHIVYEINGVRYTKGWHMGDDWSLYTRVFITYASEAYLHNDSASIIAIRVSKPEKGVDFWTEEDKAEIVDEVITEHKAEIVDAVITEHKAEIVDAVVEDTKNYVDEAILGGEW